VISTVLRRLFQRQPAQRTFVYCPKCQNELAANGTLIEDADLVRYCCSRCRHHSGWDFDAPAPLLREGRFV
jgi:hypothetical protein